MVAIISNVLFTKNATIVQVKLVIKALSLKNFCGLLKLKKENISTYIF